ncbi:MAG: hypothetical protein ACKVE4_01835 [Dissulfuribacterales bacterium]
MRTSYKIYIICILLLMGTLPVSAEFYEYIDESGIIHYTNSLTTIPPEYRSQLTRSDEIKSVSEKKNISVPDEDLPTGPPQAVTETKEPSEDIDSENIEMDESKTDAQSIALLQLREKRNTLINKKDALNKKLEALIKEKQKIENSRNSTEDINIEEYNQKVKALNKKIKQYKQDDEALRGEIETFNESISTTNATPQKK